MHDLLCPPPSVRLLLLAGLGNAFFQQATGVEAAVYYTPEVLESAGFVDEDSLLLATVGVGECIRGCYGCISSVVELSWLRLIGHFVVLLIADLDDLSAWFASVTLKQCPFHVLMPDRCYKPGCRHVRFRADQSAGDLRSVATYGYGWTATTADCIERRDLPRSAADLYVVPVWP